MKLANGFERCAANTTACVHVSMMKRSGETPEQQTVGVVTARSTRVAEHTGYKKLLQLHGLKSKE